MANIQTKFFPHICVGVAYLLIQGDDGAMGTNWNKCDQFAAYRLAACGIHRIDAVDCIRGNTTNTMFLARNAIHFVFSLCLTAKRASSNTNCLNTQWNRQRDEKLRGLPFIYNDDNDDNDNIPSI